MNIFELSLILSALLCSLVTGFILIFAIVVMPGISKFEDKEFLRAFQQIDGVIQNNQPFFLLVWLGSIISVIVTIFSSLIIFEFQNSLPILCVCCIYLFGVQGITLLIHLPLNQRIKNFDINESSIEMLNKERENFEDKWNFFNKIRTGIAFLVSLMFILFTFFYF
tara:strand:+ start:100 stop:597 length:498 start_codon:yes stop_codon:yes gene_type:complete